MPLGPAIATQLTTPVDRPIVVWVGGRDVTSLVKWDSLSIEDGAPGVTTLRIEEDLANLPEVTDQASVVVYNHVLDYNMARAYVRSRRPVHVPQYSGTEIRAEGNAGLIDDIFLRFESRGVESMQARIAGLWTYINGHLSRDLSHVQPLGELLPAQDFAGVTLRQAIESTLAQATPEADYYIDAHAQGKLHVFAAETNDAPLAISSTAITKSVAIATTRVGDEADVSGNGLDQHFNSVAFDGFALLTGSYPGGKLWRSIDRGKTWQNLGQLAASVDDIAFITAAATGTFYAGCSMSAAGSALFKSTDSGATWVQKFQPAASLATEGFAVATATLSVGTDPQAEVVLIAGFNRTAGSGVTIWRSTDGGANFSVVSSTHAVAITCRQIRHLGNGHFVATVRSATPNEVQLYHSTDAGATWISVATIASTEVYTATVRNGGALLGTHPDGLVFRYDYVPAVLALSPVAYWRLGEASGTAAADSSGNARTGTYVGAPTLGVAGLLTGDSDTAVTFASGKYVNCGAGADVGSGDASFVVSFKTTDTTTDGRLISKRNVGAGWDLGLSAFGGGVSSLTFFVDDGAGHLGSRDLTVQVNDGVRHDVVAVREGSALRIYLDGVVQGADAEVPLLGSIANSNTCYIGELQLATRPFIGTIDEPAIFNRALSAAEVAELHAAGSGAGVQGGALADLGAGVGQSQVYGLTPVQDGVLAFVSQNNNAAAKVYFSADDFATAATDVGTLDTAYHYHEPVMADWRTIAIVAASNVLAEPGLLQSAVWHSPIGVFGPHDLSIDYEAKSYANVVFVQAATPAASTSVYDHAAIAAANGVKRIATISAPDVTTLAMATSLGQMYLGRVSSATPRGRFSATSPDDGWRSGQNLRVTDTTVGLSDEMFRIHRVRTSVVRPGTDPAFRYEVEFGGERAGSDE